MNLKDQIITLEHAFADGNIDLVKKLLPSLMMKDVPQAIRINACIGEPEWTEAQMDEHYVTGITKAFELGDIASKYHVAMWHNNGAFNFKVDKVKSSTIFKELADKQHPHSMWIHASNLLSGTGAFEKDVEKGLKLLKKASFLGSAQACMTLAGFYHKGSFGLDKNIKMRDAFVKSALKYDTTLTNPYL